MESNEEEHPTHPLLMTQHSDFQWTAALHAGGLDDGWQNHLTRYLIASATATVSFEGQDSLHLFEAKVLDDPLNLYQVTLHVQAADVQVSYAALSRVLVDVPYDCHLMLKTEEGGCFVTIPAPQPPSQTEWKQVLKKLWFQLLLDEDAQLVISDAAHSLANEQPLYTFRLHADLGWEEVDAQAEAGPDAWQRELRLEFDPAEPGVLRGQVGWSESPALSHPALEIVPLASLESALGRERQTRERQLARTGARGRETRPLPVIPLPRHERRWKGRARLAALLAAVLLLVLIGGVALGAINGVSAPRNSLVTLNPSPTTGQIPSGIPTVGPTTTPRPTSTPTARPSPVGTPRPPTGPAPPPTPAPTPPKPTPTPRPSPTPTQAPSATPTTTPTPTLTPTPTDTPTPTPTPIVNFVVAPTGFSQSCSSSLSSLVVSLDNSGSTVDVNWSISITDTDPQGNVWAAADSTSGTVPAGQVATVTITPISALCADLAGNSGSFTAAISWQSGQATVVDAVSP